MIIVWFLSLSKNHILLSLCFFTGNEIKYNVFELFLNYERTSKKLKDYLSQSLNNLNIKSREIFTSPLHWPNIVYNLFPLFTPSPCRLPVTFPFLPVPVPVSQTVRISAIDSMISHCTVLL
jgi:hypothetical protein